MKRDIAIIGMAGKFPGASNINELYQNLRNGVDSIHPISSKRIKDTCLSSDKEYRVCGYMDDIDKFDFEFFNLSYTEAINMSPAQRLLLHTVYETFENSGYSIDYFDGSDTSVYAADTITSNYYEYADEYSPTLETGNSREFLASKISRHFNLLGNSILINTACSSTAVAIKLACNELLLEDSDYVLVCGVNFNLFPYKTEGDGMDILSASGKSKAFSSESDGISFGESSCAVLLKRLDKAIIDKDIIHAVIKGATVNNNGSRSSSIMAPDSILQASLMQKSWDKIGITPEDIGFIEVHGSGTNLGDCLEVEGLTLAINKYTSKKQFIPISTIKSNIGNCIFSAGLVSVIKAVLSLKHKVIFSTINCEELNPNINFQQSPVYVNRELKEWSVSESKSRYAGVTNIGRNGVNCHIVLQEYNNDIKIGECSSKESFLITISSKTIIGLNKNIDNISSYLKNNKSNIKDVSYTLNTGRKHYNFRYTIIVSDIQELITELNDYLSINSNIKDNVIDNFFFVFSDQVISKSIIDYFSENYPVFKESMNYLTGYMSYEDENSRSAIFQYCFYKLLDYNQVISKSIISTGIGKFVKALIFEEISIDKFVENVRDYKKVKSHDIEVKVKEFLEKQSNKSIVLIDIGRESEMSRIIKSYSSEINNIYLPDYDKVREVNVFLEFIKLLYINNLDLEWNKVFRSIQSGNKIELPTYHFEKVRCWLRDEPKEFETKDSANKSVFLVEEGTKIEQMLASVFGNVLEKESLSVNDNFFDLGGDTFRAKKIIKLINNEYDLNINIENLINYPSIKEFSKFIFNKTNSQKIIISIWKKVLGKELIETNDCFFELGGHSLIATQVINRLKQIFNIEINFQDIYVHPTLSELSKFVDEKISQKGNILEKSEIFISEKKEYYSLSYSQKRIFYLEQMYNSGTSYNSAVTFNVNGKFDLKHLKKTFNKLVEQHELFRTSFILIEGIPYQRIHQNIELEIEKYNFSNIADNIEKDKILKDIINNFEKPFNLNEAPLLRVGVILVSENEWKLLFDIDHIISDRATFDVLMRDFALLYNNQELLKQKIQYKDFSLWEENYFLSKEFLKKEKFWLETFNKEVKDLQLPIDFERPKIMSSKGDEYFFTIDENLTNSLRKLAKDQGVTFFTLLLTVFKTFLHKLTGQTDICIGSPYSLRDHVDFEKMVGVLLNTIVFRSNPSANKPFIQYLREVNDFSINAYNNHEYPFEMLLEKIDYKRSSDRNPIFDILFNSQTSFRSITGKDQVIKTDMNISPNGKNRTNSTFDISINLNFSGAIVYFTVQYRTSLYEYSTIKEFMDEYCLLLEQVANDPNKLLVDYILFKNTKQNKIKITNQLS